MKYVKINSVSSLYLIFSKVNGYFEETNKGTYLTLVPTNESKEKNKKYEALWIKIRDSIRSITKTQMIMMKYIWKSNLVYMTS